MVIIPSLTAVCMMLGIWWILDLGCEEGNLIDRLISRGISSSLGVEIDQANVIECIRKGIKVIHSDLDSRLEKFEDKKFDASNKRSSPERIVLVCSGLCKYYRYRNNCCIKGNEIGYACYKNK